MTLPLLSTSFLNPFRLFSIKFFFGTIPIAVWWLCVLKITLCARGERNIFTFRFTLELTHFCCFHVDIPNKKRRRLIRNNSTAKIFQWTISVCFWKNWNSSRCKQKIFFIAAYAMERGKNGGSNARIDDLIYIFFYFGFIPNKVTLTVIQNIF